MPKWCYACCTYRAYTQFGKNKSKKGGLSTECRSCKKVSDAAYHLKHRAERLVAMKEYQKKNCEKLRIKAIEYARSDTGRTHNIKATRKYYNTHKKEISIRMYENNHTLHKDKYVARYKASNAIKLKKIIPPANCQDCHKKGGVEAHHEDYTKPFDLVFLCKKCHNKRHRKAGDV